MIPDGGWIPGDPLPAFDQRSDEVSALVCACVTAFDLTGDDMWRERASIGRRWFDGRNDQGIPLRDSSSRLVFDGLNARGRSEEITARATLAFLAVESRMELVAQKAA